MDEIVEKLKKEISALKNGIFKLEAYLKEQVACLQILEQQLAAIEAENAVKVEVVEEESEENIFTQDPVKMALEIPLILEIILGELDFTSLMSSRTVAKYWDEAALNVFSKPPTKGDRPKRLNLEKLFQSSDFNPFPELEPKLTKKIYFREYCTCENPECRDSACDVPSKQKLLMFCEKFSTQIQEMNIYISPSFAPTFLRAITNQCPNLKSLNLDCGNYLANLQAQEEADLIEIKAMPQGELFRVNLNTIEFTNEFREPEIFYEPLQQIIDKAPNLTRLKLKANFYPNLTNNKNLKNLYFHGAVDKPNFSQAKLSEMLAQVKDSVEVVEIETQCDGSQNSHGFSFPVMKMLKKLIILDVFLHPLEQDRSTIFQIISSKFTNLEHLEIGSSAGYDASVEMMLNKAIQGPLVHLFKIQTLILDGVQSPSILALFSLWFPNLKELKFAMPEDGEIEAVFLALRGLKLKTFSFTIEFSFKFSDLVKALVANPELFSGLNILEIYAGADPFEYSEVGPPIVDDLGFETRQLFCEWLRSTTKNMKSVTFHDFSFSGVSALEVISVIREQQLPVHFVNNDYDS